MDGQRIVLRLRRCALEAGANLIRARRKAFGQFDLQRNPRLLAGGHVGELASAYSLRQADRPGAFARRRLASVVDYDELLGNGFTGEKVVVLACKRSGLAGDVSQKWLIIAEQRFRRGRRRPVVALEGQVHTLVALVEIIRAETGPLEPLPIDLKILAAAVHAVAQHPVMPVIPT